MRWFMIALVAALAWAGCARRPAVRPPAPPPPPVQTPAQRLQSHLEGTWESPERGGKTSEMTFEPGGQVVFKGTLASYNPARWELDPGAREIHISFPQTDDRKLDIFHLYVGQGVKAFNRPQKEVTFAFDENTWSLNVAGWNYVKADKAAIQRAPEAEPTFRSIP